MKQKAGIRCRWMRPLAGAMMAALCLVLMISTPAGAVNAFDPYPMGWYDVASGTVHPDLMASDTDVPGGQGSNIAIAYWYNDLHVTDYLDAAYAANIRVILGVQEALINSGVAADLVTLKAYVADHNDHPAVVAWYSNDEPYSNKGATILPKVQAGYTAIKEVTDKPVVLCWGEPAIVDGIAATWSGTYDIFCVDGYSCRIGEPEFSGLGPEPRSEFPYWDDWKGLIDMSKAQSDLAGKPYWSIVAGWGDFLHETDNYRLPSNAESKFHTFYSVLKEASGVLFFTFYRAVDTPARPAEPYPYWGLSWLDDVATARNDEVNLLGPAIREGSIGSNAFSADDADVIGDIYRDPGTGIFYVVAVNTMIDYSSPTITLDLQGLPPETPVAVRPLFEGDIPPIPLTAGGTQFADDFTSYGVHLYQVMYEPADCTEAIADGYGYGLVGDLNDDCDSDIDDIGLLVSAWLDCVDPNDFGCRTPWLP